MTTPAWIGLGSNVGDRKAILDAAIVTLAGLPGVAIRAVSSYHETSPVGGPPGQGAFLNASAQLETNLGARRLLATLRAIEDQAGRVRTIRWGERTLDLDILIYGTTFSDSSDLKLPHPRLALRRFVLAPLAEIAPKAVDMMTSRTIADLLANLDRQPRLLAIHDSDGRRKSTVFRRLVEELPGFGISEEELRTACMGIEPKLAFLERKAAALKAEDWTRETVQVRWIIADCYLGLDPLRSPASGARHAAEQIQQKTNEDLGRPEMCRAGAASQAALTPTLVLILPGEPEVPWRPGELTVPQLRPASHKPIEIIEEVLAVCRSIEVVG